MPQRISIDKNVMALIMDGVDFDTVSIFYIVGHGTKIDKRFIADMSVYFPWGIDNYGWYESDTGFPLLEIYNCYRRRGQMGRTPSTSYDIQKVATPSKGASNETPLLSTRKSVIPDISLTPKDLNVAFCERMLAKYYLDGGGLDDVGIVCLTGDKKLSEVLSSLNKAPHGGQYSDLLVICLCCSVARGDEHNADSRAQGYSQLL
ncbi:hypothetical protein CCU68_25360 [Pseudomonas gingeri NCPPB 3146 = LMG 5327]|uniref:Uncharacterized protein n=2 Tax=Pseudomonas gingeri TaxID=117681 RepID=A0A7Y7XVT2_9PSED|nr:hypothetical protein [Pseudomonas gingeri]NWC13260.1 hypothetical protein [Pseudomonas gingeri]PNQ89779.1 hypothetical protein CCU68_25360 [Pseudomonas gingeri NCPPB 3146 = LMG 5327]